MGGGSLSLNIVFSTKFAIIIIICHIKIRGMVYIMTRMIIGPEKYIQGSGELQRIKEHTASLGKNFLVIVSSNGLARTKEIIEQSFADSSVSLIFEIFNGECCWSEIERLRKKAKDYHSDVVIGVGGGKILDTARAVAHYENISAVIVPTIASTDSPTSAVAVVYTEAGVFSECLLLPRHPKLVLVDSAIVANAPARFLVSGMGDALSTYFEARASMRSNALNTAGGKPTKAALAIARLCYDTLLEDGLKAKLAVQKQVLTKAVENIIEANIYLSGIGFESGGLAAAHSIHNGFTVLPQCHHLYHGEKVAFGTIVQLMLENSPLAEIEEVIRFCISVGLPTTLRQMGIEEVKADEIKQIAETACAEGETIYHMPFEVTSEDVYAAIISADEIGALLETAIAVNSHKEQGNW